MTSGTKWPIELKVIIAIAYRSNTLEKNLTESLVKLHKIGIKKFEKN